MKTLYRVALPVVILLVGVAGTAWMMSNKITPERLPVLEQMTPVVVETLAHRDEQVVIQAQGTVTPAQKVTVHSQVSGTVVEVAPALVPGGRFRAGEVMARIDDRDYRALLAAQQDVLAKARLALAQEQARHEVAKDEWELLESSTAALSDNRDLALRLPQLEQARTGLAAAQAGVAKAKLDLERCTITAPFDAVVISEQVDLGQVVGPQTQLAQLVGTDHYWVQVSVPLEHLPWIELPRTAAGKGSRATVRCQTGADEIRRQGRVERLLGDLDPAGRLARVLVVIDDPLNLAGHSQGLPLLLGSYVTVDIFGRWVEDVLVIPRAALRDLDSSGAEQGSAGEALWIMDSEDRLRSKRVTVVWRTPDLVYVRNGLSDGERVVTSSLATPIEGMKLTVVHGNGANEE